MNKFLVTAFFSVLVTAVFAQTAKSVYAEVGGPGFISLNFDTRFKKGSDGLGMRIGLAPLPYSIQSSNTPTIWKMAVGLPVGLNYLIGRDKKNFLELGAGMGVFFGPHDFSLPQKTVKIGRNIFYPTVSTLRYLWVGYRWQPVKRGFTFRAGLSPVWFNDYFIPYYAGLSFGYKF